MGVPSSALSSLAVSVFSESSTTFIISSSSDLSTAVNVETGHGRRLSNSTSVGEWNEIEMDLMKLNDHLKLSG